MIRTRFSIPPVARFLITGGLTTSLSALAYLALVNGGASPGVATVASHCLGLVVGFFLHGRWSFAGSTLDAAAAGRFVAGSLVTLLLNACWTALLISGFGLPHWTPVLPMLFITPPISYALNANWVFRAKVGGNDGKADPS